MKINCIIDLELERMLNKEVRKLREYVDMFDAMTSEEKRELLEWMAQGNSVNSNPYLIYEENGCLLDILSASRDAKDMSDHPEWFLWPDLDNDEATAFDDMPF